MASAEPDRGAPTPAGAGARPSPVLSVDVWAVGAALLLAALVRLGLLSVPW
jgi:hypothetical protein